MGDDDSSCEEAGGMVQRRLHCTETLILQYRVLHSELNGTDTERFGNKHHPSPLK
jgi:hypothetical protein